MPEKASNCSNTLFLIAEKLNTSTFGTGGISSVGVRPVRQNYFLKSHSHFLNTITKQLIST